MSSVGPIDKGDVALMNQNCISFLGYLGQSSGWRDLHFAGHAPGCSLEREGGRGWPNHGVLGSSTLDKGETQQHPRQALPLPPQEMAIWAGMGMWLLYRQDFEGINSFFKHGTALQFTLQKPHFMFVQSSIDFGPK